MDLREKVSLVHKVSEYSIRFRLIEIFMGVLLCAIALSNIDGVLISIQPLSAQVEDVMVAFTQGNFNAITENYGVVFAILALFIFRWGFFGFKCGLLWFFFLLFNCLLLVAIGEYKDIMQILLAGIFIIATTCFFFIRSLLVKAVLPLILLAYSLSAWLLFLGVSNLAWFGLISVFFSDAFHLIFVICHQIREDAKYKKTLTGAIASGVRKTIPVSLLSVILLIVLEITFYFMKLPIHASEHLWHSMMIYICCILWMPFFTAAVLSFCPLESTCETMQKRSR
ncbi:MAG: hypothetical protein LBQ87_06620 [Candidatus Fibromonas sp.]|jgi:hypothetical protein|nr:hypothetical protein [Candidatus Fibromonas sp.]